MLFVFSSTEGEAITFPAQPPLSEPRLCNARKSFFTGNQKPQWLTSF